MNLCTYVAQATCCQLLAYQISEFLADIDPFAKCDAAGLFLSMAELDIAGFPLKIMYIS